MTLELYLRRQKSVQYASFQIRRSIREQRGKS